MELSNHTGYKMQSDLKQMIDAINELTNFHKLTRDEDT